MSVRVLVDGREAPSLWVRVRCPRCKVVEVTDAYRGVPTHSCVHPNPIMVAVELVPDDDIPEGS